jgi:hypothetical protein
VEPNESLGSPVAKNRDDSLHTEFTNSLGDDLANEARRMVYGDRNRDYGSPERNLTKIGMVWGALLGIDPIPPRTVAVMMTGMKLVRAAGRTNRDDLIDGVGYLLLADEASDI